MRWRSPSWCPIKWVRLIEMEERRRRVVVSTTCDYFETANWSASGPTQMVDPSRKATPRLHADSMLGGGRQSFHSTTKANKQKHFGYGCLDARVSKRGNSLLTLSTLTASKASQTASPMPFHWI